MTDEEREISEAKLDALTVVAMGVIAEMVSKVPSLRSKMPGILKTVKDYVRPSTGSNSVYQKTYREEMKMRFGNLHHEYGGSYDD